MPESLREYNSMTCKSFTFFNCSSEFGLQTFPPVVGKSSHTGAPALHFHPLLTLVGSNIEDLAADTGIYAYTCDLFQNDSLFVILAVEKLRELSLGKEGSTAKLAEIKACSLCNLLPYLFILGEDITRLQVCKPISLPADFQRPCYEPLLQTTCSYMVFRCFRQR